MVLENNLKKFLDLKREFSFLQHEAEESDKVVNEFIKVVKFCYFTQSFRQVSIFETHSANIHTHICSFTFQAVVPSFSSISRTKKYSEFSDCNQETIEDVSSFQGWKLSLCLTFNASTNSAMFR